MRHRFLRLAAAAVLALGTSGCLNSGGPDFIWFRTVHAIPDAPSLRATYEGFVYRRALNYGQSSEESPETLLSSSTTSARLNIDYFGFDNQIAGRYLELDVPLEEEHTSTVVLAGSWDAPEAIVVLSPRRARPLPSVTFQFVHAALDLGALDVYVTSPDTDLASTAPLVSLDPRAFSAALEVPFGDLRIRLTHAGTLDVVMDSGEQAFAESTAGTGPGSQWLFTITPTVVPGPSPVFLSGNFAFNSTPIHDVGQVPVLRATHAHPHLPPVDVLLKTRVAEDSEEAPEVFGVLEGLEYFQRSARVPARSGIFDLEFRESGTEEVLNSTPAILQAGTEYAAFLMPLTDEDDAFGVFLDSQTRSVATEARVRFANLAMGSQFISIYLTDDEAQQPDPEFLVLRDLRFTVVTGHLRFKPDQYFITFTRRATQDESATETVLFGPMPLDLSGGQVLSFSIFPAESEGETEVLVLYDDLLP